MLASLDEWADEVEVRLCLLTTSQISRLPNEGPRRDHGPAEAARVRDGQRAPFRGLRQYVAEVVKDA